MVATGPILTSQILSCMTLILGTKNFVELPRSKGGILPPKKHEREVEKTLSNYGNILWTQPWNIQIARTMVAMLGPDKTVVL